MNDFIFLHDIVRKAFRIILDIYGRDFQVEYKSPSDPVTQADKLVDELYIKEIGRLFPESCFLTEETYSDVNDTASSFWCIDPLDGTKDFIQKNGEFCTMIAYIENGDVTAGIIGLPVKDQIIFSQKGRGAYLTENGKRQRLSLENKDISCPGLTAIHSRNHQNSLLFKMLDRLKIEKRIARGSVGNKIASILFREADIYIHPSKFTKWWDSAAGEIILREAGGTFTDMFNRRIDYTGRNVYNESGIAASNFSDHLFLDDLSELLQSF